MLLAALHYHFLEIVILQDFHHGKLFRIDQFLPVAHEHTSLVTGRRALGEAQTTVDIVDSGKARQGEMKRHSHCAPEPGQVVLKYISILDCRRALLREEASIERSSALTVSICIDYEGNPWATPHELFPVGSGSRSCVDVRPTRSYSTLC